MASRQSRDGVLQATWNTLGLFYPFGSILVRIDLSLSGHLWTIVRKLPRAGGCWMPGFRRNRRAASDAFTTTGSDPAVVLLNII